MVLSQYSSWLQRMRITLRGVWVYLFAKAHRQRIRMLRLFYSIRIMTTLRMSHRMRRFVSSFSVRLWTDKKGFDRIVHLLSQAEFSIVIQMFIWKNDDTGRLLASTMVQAARRGVHVRIVKEAVGDVFETEGDFLGSKESADPIWQEFWNHPNIDIRHEAQHNHAKIYIIDDSVLLLTGMNIGDEYRWKWHDYLVELHGERLVEYYLGLSSRSPSAGITFVSNTPERAMLRSQVTTLLQSAQRSIIVEQAYLSDSSVLDILIAKSRAHVDVIVLLPQHADIQQNANMESVDRLMREGSRQHMKVFLAPFMIHGKVILVDRNQALIGSLNLIPSSLDQMGEMNVLLSGGLSRVLVKLNATLLKDMLKSKLVNAPLSFSPLRKFFAWFSL